MSPEIHCVRVSLDLDSFGTIDIKGKVLLLLHVSEDDLVGLKLSQICL